VESMATAIEAGDRTVRLGAHPVGIDVEGIERVVDRPGTRRKIAEIRESVGNRTCVLSIERLDYVKGPLEKLRAFEKLREEEPELHGRIVLLSVCTPPARGMSVYREIREEVDQA